MDKTLKKRDSAGGPVIVFANWFQFAPSERIASRGVETRMLLWCRTGHGKITANGSESIFFPGDWVMLPWRHEIEYDADAQNPFFVGGIHIIPSHSQRFPVVFQVGVTDNKKEKPVRGRCDAIWPGMEKAVYGRFAGGDDRMALLAAYIVEKFQNSQPDRQLMGQLAKLIVGEISLALHLKPSGTKPRPGTLFQIQEYVRAHLDKTFTVHHLAKIAKCSTASIHRQFQNCESLSPGRWIGRVRAEHAAKLLRTTTLSVREVGEQVGLSDPFHFSRFFKREVGVPPRVYRETRRFL